MSPNDALQAPPQLVLASTSPRRRELLQTLGIPFQVKPSGASEQIDEPVDPVDYVQILARRKGREVADGLKRDPGSRLILAADTVVVLDGIILGKPTDADDAVHMLTRLQGRTHTVYTGVCLIDDQHEREQVGHVGTQVTLRALAPDLIARYVATGEPLDKAGAYAIQSLGVTLVERIEGDYSNVVGLPLRLVADWLTEFGVRIF